MYLTGPCPVVNPLRIAHDSEGELPYEGCDPGFSRRTLSLLLKMKGHQRVGQRVGNKSGVRRISGWSEI
eukprot:3195082-Pyramimonas_sp.AAC.1